MLQRLASCSAFFGVLLLSVSAQAKPNPESLVFEDLKPTNIEATNDSDAIHALTQEIEQSRTHALKKSKPLETQELSEKEALEADGEAVAAAQPTGVDEDDAQPAQPEQAVSENPVTQQINERQSKVLPQWPTLPTTNEFAQLVNTVKWHQGMKKNEPMTIRLQILLDWNHASPGPIDWDWGMNSKKALRGFEDMHSLVNDGRMDYETYALLTQHFEEQDALVDYVLTEDDVNGPFVRIPSGYEAKSKLKSMGYSSLIEKLGERFHMHVNLLKKLNPESKFEAGDRITVVNVGTPLQAPIDFVRVDKKYQILYAYSAERLVATYPTTVGSSKTPSPVGTHKVINAVFRPWYNATSKTDPKEKWQLPPGPNNPVGMVWVGLSKPSYGIHGSPVPEGISRQASAGCVRLTNWDAKEFYSVIQDGTKVEFK